MVMHAAVSQSDQCWRCHEAGRGRAGRWGRDDDLRTEQPSNCELAIGIRARILDGDAAAVVGTVTDPRMAKSSSATYPCLEGQLR